MLYFFSTLLFISFLKSNYVFHDRNVEYALNNHQSLSDGKQNIRQKYVTFSIESLSALNQFLFLSVSFIKNSQFNSFNNSKEFNNSQTHSKNDFLTLFADIAIQTDLSNQIHETDFSSHSLPNSLLFFQNNRNISQKVPVLKNQLTKYTTFSSTVSISSNNFLNRNNQNFLPNTEDNDLFDNIVGCRAYWTFGNSSIPFYQSFIKLFFFTINLILIVSFLCRTRCNTTVLHLEQILSIFLLFSTFLIDNPFHYFLIVKLPKFSLIYDEISKTLFNVYLRFFIFVLFDSLRFKNRRIGRCFFIPKIFFFFFFLFFEIISSLIQAKKAVDFKWPNTLLQSFKKPNLITNKNEMAKIYKNELKFNKRLNMYSNERLLHNNLCFGLINNDVYDGNDGKNFYGKTVYFLSKIFDLSFITWFIIVIIRSFKDIDVTERYKFFMYFSVTAVMFLLIGITDCFLARMKKFANTLIPFLFKLSIHNFFAILMMIFHWPYELITDQQYLDPDEVDGGVEDFYNESDKSNGLL